MLLSTADPPIEFTTDQCQTLALDCPVTLYLPDDYSTDDYSPDCTKDDGIADSSTPKNKTKGKTSNGKASNGKESKHHPTFTAIAHHLTLIKKTEGQPSGPTTSVSCAKTADSQTDTPKTSAGKTTAPATASQTATIETNIATLKDCHLVLSVSLEQYQHILEHELFHLKPEVRGPLHQVDFWPDSPILLELGLQPYIFQDTDFDSLNESPIATVEKERAIALLSDLLSLIETEGHPKNPNARDTVSVPQKLATKSRPFIQDLLADNTPPQPSLSSPNTLRESQDQSIPVSPLGKGGLRGVAPWQRTDGWLCRSVQQRQGDETVGYATLWAYATPEQTEPVIQSGHTALDAIATLLQHTSDAVQSELEQHLPQVKQSLSLFSDELITALEQVDWETLLTTDDGTDADSVDDDGRDDDGMGGDRPISEVVKQFFDEDDWSYIAVENLAEPTPSPSQEGEPTPSPSREGDRRRPNPKSKIQNSPTPSPSQEGEPTPGPSQEGERRRPNPKSKIHNPKLLQLAFQGDAGRWTCLAQADDEAQQVVFYSLCPISVPDDRYGPIAEFILRVNDGLVIGNFELDMDQGDIRYKTSLDTEGDRLSTALMQRLVYANVHTMDTYLPGIIAVLSGDCSPGEAIASIEPTDFS